MPLTRFLRSINAEKYIINSERLLDIGCGDGYFIKRSKSRERYGLDKLLGDEVKETLNFPDEYFDYITMLAVIEHIEAPEKLLEEIYRVLRPGGKLVFTTPKKQAEFILRLYARDIEGEHESYFDLVRVNNLAADMFDVVGYHTFIFGLNQVFCLKKK